MRTGAFLIMCNQYQVKFEDLPALNFAEVDDKEAEKIIARAAKERKKRLVMEASLIKDATV